MNTNEVLAEQRVRMHAASRKATLHGRPFRVVPAVLVRSQVLRNNLGAALLPADEITEDWADMWNGIPVLVGDHPQRRGENITARDPALWEERQVGWIFSAQVEHDGHDTTRLVAEVWLDETRIDAVEGFRAVLEAVQSGRVVELSTGFRTETERRAGQFGGETYELIMHPVAPDHLVISTEMTGACSVDDGCGLGVNCSCGTRRQEASWMMEQRYAEPTPWGDNADDRFPEDTKNPIGNPHGDLKVIRRRRALDLERQIRLARKKRDGGSIAAKLHWDQELERLSSELEDIHKQEREERERYKAV